MQLKVHALIFLWFNKKRKSIYLWFIKNTDNVQILLVVLLKYWKLKYMHLTNYLWFVKNRGGNKEGGTVMQILMGAHNGRVASKNFIWLKIIFANAYALFPKLAISPMQYLIMLIKVLFNLICNSMQNLRSLARK